MRSRPVTARRPAGGLGGGVERSEHPGRLGIERLAGRCQLHLAGRPGHELSADAFLQLLDLRAQRLLGEV